MAVAAVRCHVCHSTTAAADTCQWCGKPQPGHGPREPTEDERLRKRDWEGPEKSYRSTHGPSARTYSSGHGDLIREMTDFASTYNMTATQFSRLCSSPTKDPYLYDRVINGGNPRQETIDKIREFMYKYRKADIF